MSNVSRCLLALIALSFSFTLVSPLRALASATYYCTGGANGGTCSSDGGNGDNGTNNGNNSSNNTVNVNVNPNVGYTGSGSAGNRQNNVTIPLQLPSFSASGCGARPTFYGGLTGAPGIGFGNSATFGIGLGFITAVGREPDVCHIPPMYSGAAFTPSVPFMVSSAAAAVSIATPATMTPPVSAACIRLDYDVAEFYAHDLRAAKHTYDTVRIERDMNALEKGCFHGLLIDTIAGR